MCRVPIDELENDQLVPGIDYTPGEIREEIRRVIQLINRLHLTGVDVTYWFDRENVLKGLVR